MQTASALDTGDVREGQRPDRVIGNFSLDSKWVVRKENKRKVHSEFLLSEQGKPL